MLSMKRRVTANHGIVLVSGIYASKDEARNVLSPRCRRTQAKNPWAKLLHQVQAGPEIMPWGSLKRRMLSELSPQPENV